MRKLWPALLLALAGLAGAALAAPPDRQEGTDVYLHRLNGSPELLGMLSSTDGGAFNNATTPAADGGLTNFAGAFTIPEGAMLMVQCTTAVNFITTDGGSTPLPTGYNLRLAADEKFYSLLRVGEFGVGVRPIAGAACINCCSVNRMH